MDHDDRAHPHRKQALVRTVAAFSLVGASAAAYPFLSSLAPSERAKNDAALALPLPDLVPGQLFLLRVDGRPLFLLPPDAHQLESIAKLDQDVWHAHRDNRSPQPNAFAFRGISLPGGRALHNVPAGESTFPPPSYHLKARRSANRARSQTPYVQAW